MGVIAGCAIALTVLSLTCLGFQPLAGQAAYTADCEQLGWFPTEFGLKDHSVFWYDGYYYLISIYLPGEQKFAYGRSTDLCNWDDLSPVMETRVPGSWDETAIWAPFVYQENGTFYMVYTGVKGDNYNFTQSIMLATTTNPADPLSWQSQGMIFQPDHEGMIWQDGEWADCRDPTLVKVDDIYYLYYTGRDTAGGIIGLATATSLDGPWTDWGAIFPSLAGAIPESATLAQYDSAYYLFYHHPGQGEFYFIGPGPSGPWQGPYDLFPGWAHEVWQSVEGDWYISYLTFYTVTISPLMWNSFYSPPHPFIGSSYNRILLPLVRVDSE